MLLAPNLNNLPFVINNYGGLADAKGIQIASNPRVCSGLMKGLFYKIIFVTI